MVVVAKMEMVPLVVLFLDDERQGHASRGKGGMVEKREEGRERMRAPARWNCAKTA